jgi:hypothetical protein
LKNRARERSAMASSTRGYCQEIGEPQLRHFLCSRMKLIMGILSYHLMGCRHLGHLEAGKTMDSFSVGSRTITTFKKLPTTAPRTNVKTIVRAVSIIIRFF